MTKPRLTTIIAATVIALVASSCGEDDPNTGLGATQRGIQDLLNDEAAPPANDSDNRQ